MPLPYAAPFLGISYVSVLLFIMSKEQNTEDKKSKREGSGLRCYINRRAVTELFSKPNKIHVLVNIIIGEMKFCSHAFLI